MKQLFLSTMLVLLSSLMGMAQSLDVTYKVTFNTGSPELFAENGLNEEMRKGLANAYSNVVLTYQLHYVDGISEFRLIPSTTKQEITFMGQTIDLNVAMAQQANNVTYKNHLKDIIIDKVSVFGKEFLVIDSLGREIFLIHDTQIKEILGFECVKAVSEDGKKVVWFAPHLPLGNEPISSGLPGLILELDNSQQTFIAISIDDGNTSLIQTPSGGKEMTRDEFDKMVHQRIEMMKRGASAM